jgi:2-oxo-4-hydroxy-4-carboxy-5-ureidoimidazoline decarboxylase
MYGIFSVQEGVLRGISNLAGRATPRGELSPESIIEQGSAGLLDLSPEELTFLISNDQKYITKFNFPFIVCARQNKKKAIMTNIVIRMKNTSQQELRKSLEEVKKISGLRLVDLVGLSKAAKL